MNSITGTRRLGGSSIAAIFASPVGPRPLLDPREPTLSDVMSAIDGNTSEVKTIAEKSKAGIDGLGARLSEVEQIITGIKSRGGKLLTASLTQGAGKTVADSDQLTDFIKGGGRTRIEVKSTTLSSVTAPVVRPDQVADPLQFPRRRLFLRDLVTVSNTESNLVVYPRQSVRDIQAAAVAENPSAPKPQSSLGWEMPEYPVRTLAHWVIASQQILQDAPVLVSLIDNELQFGLDDLEERQMLLGDGSGENLLGVIPQAQALDKTPFTIQAPNPLDILLMAIAQCEMNLLPATGVVLNPIDFANIQAMKDGQNRYLCGDPLGAAAKTLWEIPKVISPIMTKGQFLVGAFKDGAQIFDRKQTIVLASTEDRDNFVRNLVTILAEKRLAFAVKRPKAFVTGSLSPTS